MKKIMFIISMLLVLSICSCSQPANETISNHADNITSNIQDKTDYLDTPI